MRKAGGKDGLASLSGCDFPRTGLWESDLPSTRTYFIFLFFNLVSVHGVPMELRGQLGGVGSLLPPHGAWGFNSGRQAWWR